MTENSSSNSKTVDLPTIDDLNNKTMHDYRAVLNTNLTTLKKAFESGTNINDIVHARAKIMDLMLVNIWEQKLGLQKDQFALVAVGGYGRGELHPHSDVDIMILLDQQPKADQDLSTIEAFITLLWDLKLEIGHSVRTCADCSQEASKDVTVVTNLMESRLLAGSTFLFEQMQSVIAESRIWSKEDFFEAKLSEQKNRHTKYGDTAYQLEPNIKEGPGGLRDIQTIFWVAKRYFNAEKLEDLTELGFLTASELESLLACRELLWKIRFALHSTAHRREDRLLFGYQRELAETFGYHDENNNLAVEQFMQNYYRSVTELERLSEMLLQLLYEAINTTENTALVKINKRFEVKHGYLRATKSDVFMTYPPALLEIFLIMQRNPELRGVSAETIRLIRNSSNLINQRFRDDIINRNLFMSILKEPSGISHELRRMNRYGILAAYLPEFENIVGRMQYDLFHIYTVDVHTLFVLRNVRRFSVPEHASWQPTCSKIFPTLEYPEILYIAALFHDIAKGRGGDHSELGAEDAEHFCINHALNNFITQTVVWLVKNHLLMSMTAQRQDISDPKIIREFALKIGDEKILDYLYLLTVADISATNPELLSSWKSRLLLELYLRTRYVFRHGLATPIDARERIKERQSEALKTLAKQSINADTCNEIWSDFGDDYFLRHNAEEIAWHTQSIANATKEDLPIVLISPTVTRGATPIFIYAQDNEEYFAITTSVMARLGLNIVDARIIASKSGMTLDTYLVLDQSNQAITDKKRIDEILAILSSSILASEVNFKIPKRSTPQHLKHFDTPTQITFTDHPDDNGTLLEVIAGDRHGLLAMISRALLESSIKVHNAKISTIGENAENIFSITDLKNMPLKNPKQLEVLTEALHKYIDSNDDYSNSAVYEI